MALENVKMGRIPKKLKDKALEDNQHRHERNNRQCHGHSQLDTIRTDSTCLANVKQELNASYSFMSLSTRSNTNRSTSFDIQETLSQGEYRCYRTLFRSSVR
jgi:hypothetical protein